MFTNKIAYVPVLLFFVALSSIFSQPRLPLTVDAAGMRPLEMKISGDGKRIVAAYDSCTIVWDIATRKILRRIPRRLSYYPDYIFSVKALNQDGSILAVGDDQILNLYNTENNRLIKQFTVFEYREDPNKTNSFGVPTMIGWQQEKFKHIYFTPDRKNIIVISDEDKIRYVDLTRNTISLVNVSHDPDIPRPASWGDILDLNIFQGRAVFRDNDSIIIFNLFSGQKEGEISLKYNNKFFYSISFSLSGDKNKRSILLADNKDYEDYIFVCDTENRKILGGRKIDGRAHLVQLTAEDNIAALARDGYIFLYNFQTGTEIARLIAYEEPKPPIAPHMPQTVLMPRKAMRKTFQLGSFLFFNNALRLISDIEAEGFNPFIERARINNSTFWRVVINDVPENEILTFRGLLTNAGFNDIWIRQGTPEPRQ